MIPVKRATGGAACVLLGLRMQAGGLAASPTHMVFVHRAQVWLLGYSDKGT